MPLFNYVLRIKSLKHFKSQDSVLNIVNVKIDQPKLILFCYSIGFSFLIQYSKSKQNEYKNTSKINKFSFNSQFT